MPAPSIPSTNASVYSMASGFRSIVESIMMEAAEKCDEIDVKCDEEYQVLRRKEISEQGEIIERADKKRREAVMKDDRVCYTKLINSFRLAQLKAKNDIFNDILTTVKQRVEMDTTSRYHRLLENSLTQALYMLMEPEVYISCRKRDQSVISSTFPPVAHTYEKNTKLRVSIGFSKHSLPDNSSAGGMLVYNKTETITVNCSLDSRVDQVCYLAMPMIVEMLFAGVLIMKEIPKLSLQKALSPSPKDRFSHLEEEQPKKRKTSQDSMSPLPQGLLEERLGIGSSKLNILGPNKAATKDEHDDQQSNHSEQTDEQNGGGAQVRRSTAKSTDSRSSEPDPDKKRRSKTKSSSSQEHDKQGPSSKKQ